MEYYITVGSIPVPVTEEVYKVYCKGERKERYFRESDIRNHMMFYDALDTDELNGCDLFWDADAEPVEEAAQKHWLLQELRAAVGELDKSEQELIARLYLYGDSLRAVSRESSIPLSTLHGHHKQILNKLRKKLEK